MSSSPNPSAPQAAAPAARRRHRRPDNWRETVESIVVAFVLAFLIRAFEAEAFVIPTGSMAPTLMGRHKDVTCRQCGYGYRVGTGEQESDDRPSHAVCPNCRFDNLTPSGSFNGDRILVLKFPYAFAKPKRWDVSVFHYPEEAAQNYIKRLVGIGPEELRLYGGDVYRRVQGESAWQIVGKPPRKQQVLQMLVYDNDHPPRAMAGGAWRRWSDSHGAWVAAEGKSFECQPSAEWAHLHYYHLVPEFDDWDDPAASAEPRLITDFYAYNASERTGLSTYGDHWVGDLTIRLEVELLEPGGELHCELNEGIGAYQCRFDLETGRVSLWQQIWSEDGAVLIGELSLGEADTALRGTGRHRVSFANVDDRLTLWVDGSLVAFEQGTEGVVYQAPHTQRMALRVAAEHPHSRSVLVLVPEQTGADAAYAQDLREQQSRLESVFAALGESTPRRIPYAVREDADSPTGWKVDKLDHLLPVDESTPVILLGRAEHKRALLAEHQEFLAQHQLELYATGFDTSEEDLGRQYELIHPVHPAPTVRDLKPVDIAASGARLRVGHLRLTRDVYYVHSARYGNDTDYDIFGNPAEFFADPLQWPETFEGMRDNVFRLEAGQYLMLGDNSPRSKDSRGWDSGPEVVEKLLIGRAFFIYWPHGKPLLGLSKAPPLWPHFKRMQFIR